MILMLKKVSVLPVSCSAAASSGEGTEIKAPMPGAVIRITAEAGTEVSEGDEVLVIEAMKMETPIKAAGEWYCNLSKCMQLVTRLLQVRFWLQSVNFLSLL